MKKLKKSQIALLSVGAVLVVVAVFFISFLTRVFPADEAVQAALDASVAAGRITVERICDDGRGMNLRPGTGVGVKKALIFYPGARIEPEAYALQLLPLAEMGVDCYIVSFPMNLATMKKDAAEEPLAMIREKDPAGIDVYVAGHSMGASAVSSYLAENTDKFKGFILMGSFSNADLTRSGLKALTLRGSEDGLMAKRSDRSPLENLPADTVELVIAGGCHAFFGTYGPQPMDGEPTITREAQQAETVRAIAAFMEI